MLITFDMSIYTPRSGSALQKVCVISLTWEQEAQSAERQLISTSSCICLVPGLTHLTAGSGETAGQFSPAPMQEGAVFMAQQRHGLPFPDYLSLLSHPHLP